MSSMMKASAPAIRLLGEIDCLAGLGLGELAFHVLVMEGFGVLPLALAEQGFHLRSACFSIGSLLRRNGESEGFQSRAASQLGVKVAGIGRPLPGSTSSLAVEEDGPSGRSCSFGLSITPPSSNHAPSKN